MLAHRSSLALLVTSLASCAQPPAPVHAPAAPFVQLEPHRRPEPASEVQHREHESEPAPEATPPAPAVPLAPSESPIARFTHEEEARWPATVERRVRFVDAQGAPIGSAHVTLVPSGDALAERLVELNPPDLWTDPDGFTDLRCPQDATAQVSVELPLEPPVKVRVGPSQRRVSVPGLTVVRCRVRHFAGFTAVALRGERVLARFEWPTSDAIHSEPIVVAWPRGADRVVVGVAARAATLRAPSAPCVLR